MGVAGALLTAEQLVAWQGGLNLLEQRERVADRLAGIDRTAEQRRADLFAALPAMVLAGTAQDRAAAQVPAHPGKGGSSSPSQAWSCGRTAEGGCPAADGPDCRACGGGHSIPAEPATGPMTPWTLGPGEVAAQVVVNVLVPVSTVLDLSCEPGELDRFGAVAAAHVRLVRPHAFRKVLVDARSGRPLAMDDRVTPAAADASARRRQVQAMLTPAVVTDVEEPAHDPSAGLARLVDVRDVHCCGPGCSSTRTDRDHVQPWPDGATTESNLGRLSRRCHRAKHHGWTLVRYEDGSTSWTSPLARSYHRPGPHPPPPHVDLWQVPPPIRPAPVVEDRWATGRDATSNPSPSGSTSATAPRATVDEPPF